MILIEFLKMVVQNIAYLRIQASPLAMAPTRVIPLGAFQYAVVGEVGFCLNRRLGPLLLTPFQEATMGLPPCRSTGFLAGSTARLFSMRP